MNQLSTHTVLIRIATVLTAFSAIDAHEEAKAVAGGDKARVFVDKDEGARRRDRIMVNCGDWSLAPSLSFASSLRSSF